MKTILIIGSVINGLGHLSFFTAVSSFDIEVDDIDFVVDKQR